MLATLYRQLRYGIAVSFAAFSCLLLMQSFAFAQPLPKTSHSHLPIELQADPIVSRIDVNLVRPRRVALDPDGNIFVADWEAGRVIRVDGDGIVSTVVEGLSEPAGLAFGPMGTLYVSVHAVGLPDEGSILSISPMGDVHSFADGLTGPTDLAMDMYGNLFVACTTTDQILRIKPDGRVETYATNIPSPIAIEVGEMGELFVASRIDGVIWRVASTGEASAYARGMGEVAELVFDPSGHLLVTHADRRQISWLDQEQQLRPYAAVPKGTVALAFDAVGNFVMVNWEHGLLIRVTTRLSVPCPHCEQQIPLHLVPNRNPRQQPPTPEKTDGPVI